MQFSKKVIYSICLLLFSNVLQAQIPWTHGTLYDGLSTPNVIDTLFSDMQYVEGYQLCNNTVNVQTINDTNDFHRTVQWYSFKYQGELDLNLSFSANLCGTSSLFVNSDSLYLYGPFESIEEASISENLPLATQQNALSINSFGGAFLSTLSNGYYFVKYVLDSKFGGPVNLCTSATMTGGSCLPITQCESNLTAISSDEYRLCNSMSCDENLTICDDNQRLFWFYDPSCSHTNEVHRLWLSTQISNPSTFGLSIDFVNNCPIDWKAPIIEVNFYPTNSFLGNCGGIDCNGSGIHCSVGSESWDYSSSYGALSAGDYLVEIVWSTSGHPKNQCNIASVVKFSGVSCPEQIFLSDWGFSLNEDGNVSIGESSYCENCLPRLMPEPSKKYVMEAWVSQGNIPFGSQTLTHPRMHVYVHHSGSSTVDSYSVTPSTVHPIVDDWQLVTLEFTTPIDIDYVDVALSSDDGSIVYFDDIRFFPFDGSMKTYVYDPVNLRFVAELDERHFATFYEYDEEGKLMRVKKETERGVMTIQETHNSTIKQP